MNNEINTSTQELIPYIDALGLAHPPFTANIPNQAYYLDAELEQHLNQLKHLVQTSPMALVVIGAPGSGKTCLKEIFLQQAADNLRCCSIHASVEMSEDELLIKLADCLDIPNNIGKPAIVALMQEQLGQMRKKDLLPVLLIDDAHLMTSECMDFLNKIQESGAENQALWRVILFTDPDLMPALMQQTFRQHFIQLNPFSRSQVEKYLNYRLKLAGLVVEFPFFPEEIDQVEQQSGGIPAEINQAAHELLMEKFGQPEPPTKPVKPLPPKTRKAGKKIGIGVFVLLISAILALVLLYQEQINRLFQQDPKKTTSSKITLPEKPHYLVKQVPKTVPIIRANPYTPPAPVKKPEPKKPEVVEPKPVSRAPLVISPKIEKKLAEKTPTQPTKKAEATKPASRPVPPAIKKPGFDTVSGIPKWLKQKEWVMSQNPGHYSIQLAASSKTDVLLQLAAIPTLEADRALYRIKRNRTDWYVLLHGTYPDRQAALRAARRLPQAIQRNRPWVRKLEEIQAEIRKGHK